MEAVPTSDRRPYTFARRVIGEPRLNHRPAVDGGVLGHECADVLRRFFAERR